VSRKRLCQPPGLALTRAQGRRRKQSVSLLRISLARDSSYVSQLTVPDCKGGLAKPVRRRRVGDPTVPRKEPDAAHGRIRRNSSRTPAGATRTRAGRQRFRQSVGNLSPERMHWGKTYRRQHVVKEEWVLGQELYLRETLALIVGHDGAEEGEQGSFNIRFLPPAQIAVV